MGATETAQKCGSSEGGGRTCHNLIPQLDDLENIAQMQSGARRRHSCQDAEGALHVRRDARLELVAQREALDVVGQGTANGAHRGRAPAPPRKVLQHPRCLGFHLQLLLRAVSVVPCLINFDQFVPKFVPERFQAVRYIEYIRII